MKNSLFPLEVLKPYDLLWIMNCSEDNHSKSSTLLTLTFDDGLLVCLGVGSLIHTLAGIHTQCGGQRTRARHRALPLGVWHAAAHRGEAITGITVFVTSNSRRSFRRRQGAHDALPNLRFARRIRRALPRVAQAVSAAVSAGMHVNPIRLIASSAALMGPATPPRGPRCVFNCITWSALTLAALHTHGAVGSDLHSV